jgi:hypothetical protein
MPDFQISEEEIDRKRDPARMCSVLECLKSGGTGALSIGQDCHAMHRGQGINKDFQPLPIEPPPPEWLHPSYCRRDAQAIAPI